MNLRLTFNRVMWHHHCLSQSVVMNNLSVNDRPSFNYLFKANISREIKVTLRRTVCITRYEPAGNYADVVPQVSYLFVQFPLIYSSFVCVLRLLPYDFPLFDEPRG